VVELAAVASVGTAACYVAAVVELAAGASVDTAACYAAAVVVWDWHDGSVLSGIRLGSGCCSSLGASAVLGDISK